MTLRAVEVKSERVPGKLLVYPRGNTPNGLVFSSRFYVSDKRNKHFFRRLTDHHPIFEALGKLGVYCEKGVVINPLATSKPKSDDKACHHERK
ncbi:MAG: hypothetical protein CM15mP95_3190 [Alphaproteobacteria bacterium]|nr:MAG: hypothetical protein CM15mP95_3190 [Alphaproteobacteria bacterium]